MKDHGIYTKSEKTHNVRLYGYEESLLQKELKRIAGGRKLNNFIRILISIGLEKCSHFNSPERLTDFICSNHESIQCLVGIETEKGIKNNYQEPAQPGCYERQGNIIYHDFSRKTG
jgi:hypothetical protein